MKKNKRCTTIVHQSSFTLLEIIVVLSLLSIVITLTVPSFSFFQNYLLSLEVETLRTTCQYLREKALVTGQEENLYLNLSSHSYHYLSFSGAEITHNLSKNSIFGYLDGVKGPPSSPTKKIRSASTFHDNTITFHPHGTISSGTVYLTTSNHSALYALTSGIATHSLLRIYRCDGKRWKLW